MTEDAASARPATPILAASRRRTLARLKAVALLAALLPLLLYAAVAAWLHEQEFATARMRLDHAARIAQEHALKLFDTNAMLLQRMLDLQGSSSEAELLADGQALHQRLQALATGLPQVQGLFINGADSRSIATSRAYPPPRDIDFRDREWYRVHTGSAAPPDVFVSDRIISRITGESAFDMSKRRVLADGGYGGSVHVSLLTSYLTDFYRELARTVPGLHVQLLRSDGHLIAQWPGETAAGARLAPGDAALPLLVRGVETADVDGSDGLRKLRSLGKLPLYVSTRVDRSAVLAQWQRRVGWLGLFVLPTTLGFVWMAWVALRRTREELDAVQQLDDEKGQRQRIEMALLQSQKLEAMGRLTGGVAHDFNNLLMVVNSNLYLHRRLYPEAAASPQLTAIERAVGAGAKLTRQLLAFARKQALLPERVDLQERLPALLDLLRPVLGSSITLHCEVEPDTGAIEVDLAELELSLINLAVNARDALQGSGRMTVCARNAASDDLPAGLPARPDGSGWVLLDVRDDGPGIDPAVAARAFEPFFTTKPVGSGTGLGLAQVLALCQSAGGSARIAAMPDGGTQVQLFFKRAERPAESERAAAPPVAAALQCRLLLVEDNEAVAASTRQLLESMGCEVTRVASGREALSLLQSRAADEPAFDLALSDIEMPGDIDGIALAGLLAGGRPALPAVLMTGYAARLEQAVQQRLDVLPKPCSPAMLADAIGRVLGRRRIVAPATATT